VVAEEVAAARLFPVRDAPQFVRPVHVIYPTDSDSEVRAAALQSLRAAIAADAAS
jgi:hypothetical protein